MLEVAATACVLLPVIAWMAFRMSGLHRDLSDVYSLVARMLKASSLKEAEAEAEAHRQQKMAEGRWRS